MEILSKKTLSRRFSPVLFHIILWTIWIGLPLINSWEHERFRLFNFWLIPISLTNIPLFLFNSEWLIPQIFKKKGITTYLLSLILLAAAFSILQYFMKDWIIPDELRLKGSVVFFTVVPVIFVLAISTGYGFIIYLNKQEKIRQEEQQMRLRSELSFLRSQISPHFIFNILNSIVYLIRTKSARAEEVTLKLSELMRYMLYNEQDEQVSLEREVNYLKNYIDLQKVRFDEDVTIDFQLEGQVGTRHIEPMLLIPFVENAFKHGVGLIREPEINVHLIVDGDQLFFVVRNKMNPEANEEKDSSSGIGIRNVKRRLELLYPGQHHLEILEEGEWFKVHLELKLITYIYPDSFTKDQRHETQMYSRR